jgi:hypothetical protein
MKAVAEFSTGKEGDSFVRDLVFVVAAAMRRSMFKLVICSGKVVFVNAKTIFSAYAPSEGKKISL